MTDHPNNVYQFPPLKPMTQEEATQLSERMGAKTGAIIYDCPCGCGNVVVIEIGEPSGRDLLWYAEKLKNHVMIEELTDGIEEDL